MLGEVGLLECSGDEAVASIGDQRLCLLVGILTELAQGEVSSREEEASSGVTGDKPLLDVLVSLQELDR